MWNSIRSWAAAVRSRLTSTSSSTSHQVREPKRARFAYAGAASLDRMERREVLSATSLTAAPDLSVDLDALTAPIIESLPTDLYSWASRVETSSSTRLPAAPTDLAMDLALERSLLSMEREQASAWDWLDRPEVNDSASIVVAEAAALGLGGAAALRLMDDAIEDLARLTGSFRRVAVRIA